MDNTEKKFQENRFEIFEKLVRKHFSFLEKDFGFKFLSAERSDDACVVIKYISNKVFLNFFYGHPGYELDVSFGRVGIEDQPNANSFRTGDLLYLDGNKNWLDYQVYSAYSYDNLVAGLPKLASFLKECGRKVFLGDSNVYLKMLNGRQKHLERQDLLQIKNKATAAWDKKNYKELIKLLNPFRTYLSPLEKKRFDYSLKKVS